MSDVEERAFGDLTVRIDRTLCVGFGHCVEDAPEAFALDDEGLVTFGPPQQIDRDRLLHACDLCPVEALSVYDADNNQLVP